MTKVVRTSWLNEMNKQIGLITHSANVTLLKICRNWVKNGSFVPDSLHIEWVVNRFSSDTGESWKIWFPKTLILMLSLQTSSYRLFWVKNSNFESIKHFVFNYLTTGIQAWTHSLMKSLSWFVPSVGFKSLDAHIDAMQKMHHFPLTNALNKFKVKATHHSDSVSSKIQFQPKEKRTDLIFQHRSISQWKSKW